MTDLHCHILFNMDDGPADINGSLELCAVAWRNGIGHIAATPHIAELGKTNAFLERRRTKLEELRGALEKSDIRVALYPGAEVMLGGGEFEPECLRRLTINHSRYLLIEFPFTGFEVRWMIRYVKELGVLGLVPIFAHPERYPLFQRDYGALEQLMEAGALLQVDASSFCPTGSRAERKLTEKLLRRRAASFLATDAHSVFSRSSNLLDMLKCLPPDIDFDYLDALVNGNPNHVLRDDAPDSLETR